MFAATAGLLLLILKLSSEVSEGETQAFDIAILRGMRAAAERPDAIARGIRLVMLDMTALGDAATLMFIILVVSGFLLATGKRGMALFLIVAPSSGMILVELLKSLFDRPRPDIVAHWGSFTNTSFPSGHAAGSAIVYLTIAALIARTVQSHGLRLYVLVVATLLTFVIGISRVYLGVHWPTDVLAGWIIGAGWAWISSSIAWWLQARRQLEQPAA